jgi:hypothetical protein
MRHSCPSQIYRFQEVDHMKYCRLVEFYWPFEATNCLNFYCVTLQKTPLFRSAKNLVVALFVYNVLTARLRATLLYILKREKLILKILFS